jgi:diketogulonate reductase-like aldo/keto reductase
MKPSIAKSGMLAKKIPSTGEELPVIGVGTWQTFDAGDDSAARAPLAEVLKVFAQAGGRIVDSSPMYGTSESVAGDLITQLGLREQLFIATKVWTSGRDEGIRQMNESFRRLRVARMDLMQVHNLVDWRTHLETLRAWKKEGIVRYIGVTHYQLGAFGDLERIATKESIDFVQLPYSIVTRDAEARLLPAAAASGVAVLVMRPFEEGALFARVRGKALPPWAADFDCASWAQFFLKFILGHPAVTCPIPATASVKHLADNLAAGRGRLPDAATRKKMIEYLGA